MDISSALGPPLSEGNDAPKYDGVHVGPDRATDWDGALQPAPDLEVSISKTISEWEKWLLRSNGVVG